MILNMIAIMQYVEDILSDPSYITLKPIDLIELERKCIWGYLGNYLTFPLAYLNRHMKYIIR